MQLAAGARIGARMNKPSHATAPGLDPGCSMGELIVRAIRRGGERIAFVLDEQRISYRAFGDMLSRMVQALAARGVKRGDAIAVLSSNRPEAFLVTAAGYLMGLRFQFGGIRLRVLFHHLLHGVDGPEKITGRGPGLGHLLTNAQEATLKGRTVIGFYSAGT